MRLPSLADVPLFADSILSSTIFYRLSLAKDMFARVGWQSFPVYLRIKLNGY
jgi:hypothetical protein